MEIASVCVLMKTVAITYWNEIVSPMFDVSCRILIIRSDNFRYAIDVRKMSLFEKADNCACNGVKVLICGAISNLAQSILRDKEIVVISWVCGSVDEIIMAYQNDINITEKFLMPGCSRRKCAGNRRLRRDCIKKEKHAKRNIQMNNRSEANI